MMRKKNKTIALNILYTKEKEICPAYISKINLNFEKHIILLMIPNEEKEGWHYDEKNKPTIALNILYTKEKEICPAYISKINLNFEKQIIILMIPKEEKEGWHYPAVKKTVHIIKKNNIKTLW